MYFKGRTISLVVCFISAINIANAANTMTEQYKNQRGSVLKLEREKQGKNTGKLSGTFTTAVGNCPQDMNKPMPLSGYYNGNVISISVNFPNCKQVVAMTGYINKNGTQINTLWLDAQAAKDFLNKDWNSNIIGTDVYKKG